MISFSSSVSRSSGCVLFNCLSQPRGNGRHFKIDFRVVTILWQNYVHVSEATIWKMWSHVYSNNHHLNFFVNLAAVPSKKKSNMANVPKWEEIQNGGCSQLPRNRVASLRAWCFFFNRKWIQNGSCSWAIGQGTAWHLSETGVHSSIEKKFKMAAIPDSKWRLFLS